MSFLADPPMLVACGAASQLLPSEGQRKAARVAVLGIFLGTSISLYANGRSTRWLARLCRAESGRDWMLNSGVTRFEHEQPPVAVHALAVALFAAYPWWYRLGVHLGARFGSTAGHTRS